MSEENKDKPEAPPLKVLSKEVLTKQIEGSKKFVQEAQQRIAGLTRDIEQQLGVIGYSEHLLKQFEIPSVPEEPKKEKPELEVK